MDPMRIVAPAQRTVSQSFRLDVFVAVTSRVHISESIEADRIEAIHLEAGPHFAHSLRCSPVIARLIGLRSSS